MTMEEPNFLEWLIPDPDNWHLKENSPEWAKQAFERFMALLNGR